MSSTVTTTAIAPEWQNVYRKAMTAIVSGGSSNTKSLNLLYGDTARAYAKDLYEFERKYEVNGSIPLVMRGGQYLDIGGMKKVLLQFNPLPWKIKSSYSAVDLQKMSQFLGDTAKESFRTDAVTTHLKRIKKSLNNNAIVSIRGGVVQNEFVTAQGVAYTDQNYGLIWSNSVGAGSFPTRMQNGVTITNVDWGNASTTLVDIETSIADIVRSAEDKGIAPEDLMFLVGKDTFNAIGAKITAYLSTTKANARFDYNVDRIGGTIQLGTTMLKRVIDSCVINSTTYNLVEDKYITAIVKPQYHDWVYMAPEDVNFLYTPVEFHTKEVMDLYGENWEILTQSRQFLCPDTNGIFTVKVIAG
jgi:hypothetical protein